MAKILGISEHVRAIKERTRTQDRVSQFQEKERNRNAITKSKEACVLQFEEQLMPWQNRTKRMFCKVLQEWIQKELIPFHFLFMRNKTGTTAFKIRKD